MSRAGENVTGGQQTVEKRPKTFHEQKLKPRVHDAQRPMNPSLN